MGQGRGRADAPATTPGPWVDRTDRHQPANGRETAQTEEYPDRPNGRVTRPPKRKTTQTVQAVDYPDRPNGRLPRLPTAQPRPRQGGGSGWGSAEAGAGLGQGRGRAEPGPRQG